MENAQLKEKHVTLDYSGLSDSSRAGIPWGFRSIFCIDSFTTRLLDMVVFASKFLDDGVVLLGPASRA
jgi:hypothetical protein